MSTNLSSTTNDALATVYNYAREVESMQAALNAAARAGNFSTTYQVPYRSFTVPNYNRDTAYATVEAALALASLNHIPGTLPYSFTISWVA